VCLSCCIVEKYDVDEKLKCRIPAQVSGLSEGSVQVALVGVQPGYLRETMVGVSGIYPKSKRDSSQVSLDCFKASLYSTNSLYPKSKQDSSQVSLGRFKASLYSSSRGVRDLP
jgi:hypothetical protein